MFAVVIALLSGVLVAAGVVLYVAFPYRGEEIPGVPHLSDALRKGVAALPTLEDSDSRQ